MKIVLTEEVTKLGIRGDIRQAKDGYVRNWLLPQRKAVLLGTQAGKAILAEMQEKRAKKKLEKKQTPRKIKVSKSQKRQQRKERKENKRIRK